MKQLPNMYKNTKMAKYRIQVNPVVTKLEFKRIKGLILNIEKRFGWCLNLKKEEKEETMKCFLIDINAKSYKKIAEEFCYSPAAISEYLSGKKVKDSKLNIIASLYLKVKALEKGDIIFTEKLKYENIIEEQQNDITELKAEILALTKLIALLDKRQSNQTIKI